MSRFEIAASKLMPGMSSKAWSVWIVMEGGTPVHVAMSKADAEAWLTIHKEDIAHDCSHEQMFAEREVTDECITLECERCGMVGEVDFEMRDIVWIGQQ